MPGRLCSREQSSKWCFVKSCSEGLLGKFWPLTSGTGKNWNGWQPISFYKHNLQKVQIVLKPSDAVTKSYVRTCCSVVLLNIFLQLCLLIAIWFTCKKSAYVGSFMIMVYTDMILSQSVFKLENKWQWMNYTTVVRITSIKLRPSVAES